jgi:hypothetical protein
MVGQEVNRKKGEAYIRVSLSADRKNYNRLVKVANKTCKIRFPMNC